MIKIKVLLLAVSLFITGSLAGCINPYENYENCYTVHQRGESHLPGERRCD